MTLFRAFGVLQCFLSAVALAAAAGCRPAPPVPRTPEPPRPFGESVAFDAALSLISVPGRLDAPASYSNDTCRYVADLIAATGVRHVRERLRWRDVAPKRDVWEPGRYLGNARLLDGLGLKVSGMFHDVAECTRAPDGGMLPRDPLATFDFCRRLAATFGDAMEMWEFWNEESAGYTKEGAWEYAAHLKAAAEGFRAGGFRGEVAGGALCGEERGEYDHALYGNAVAPYLDVMNFHTYCEPSRYGRVIGEMRAFMAAHGMAGRPLVLTECGTNMEGPARLARGPGLPNAHSPEQEALVAEFVVKSQILTRMEGVARNYQFVFGAHVERFGKKDWGFLRADGTPKPAVAAMTRLMAEVGAGTLLGEVGGTPPAVRAFLFQMPEDGFRLVHWLRSDVDDGEGEIADWPAFLDRRQVELPWRLELPGGGRAELLSRCDPEYAALPAPAEVVRPPISTGCRETTPAGQLDRRVIFRAILERGAYSLGGNKSRVELKRDGINLKLEVWNLDGCGKTGAVRFCGEGSIDGLPKTVALPPWGKATLDLSYAAGSADNPEIAFGGMFDGREVSAIRIPVYSEARYLRECAVVTCDAGNLERWRANSSADSASCVWDEEERAMRFDAVWTNERQKDRWFFPSYWLDLPQESLDRAVLLTFDVRSVQDKPENDYKSARLFFKGRGKPQQRLCAPPASEWETRRVDISESLREGGVSHVEFGGHPAGRRVTYWIRNVRVFSK